MNHPRQDRRAFLKTTAAITACSLLQDWAGAETVSDKLGPLLPTRRLLRNGFQTTAFCLGGYHVGKADNPAVAERLVERSIELGVRFFDNARKYYDGRAENYFGRFLVPKYREHVFIMTKSPGRSAQEVNDHLDASLAAMKLDYVDLWQIHTLSDRKDIEQRIENGVIDAFLEAKAKGKTKHLGFTGHVSPLTHLYFLEYLEKKGLTQEFETCQMPLNVCDSSFESFQGQVLPVLIKKQFGIIAMKTMAGGSIMGKPFDITPKEIAEKGIPDVIAQTGISLKDLHQYVYTLPISSLCSGCENAEQLEQNIAALTSFKSLSREDMDRLVNLAKPFSGRAVENYKRLLAADGTIVRRSENKPKP